MAKKLAPSLILLGLILALPMMVLAVQDVVVSSEIDVYIATPGTILKLSPATVDKIEVSDTAMIVTMSAGGNAVTISSPSRYRFTVTGITDPGTTCASGSSTLVIPSQASQVAVTVDPLDICPSSGGGGGAAPVTVTPAKPTTTNAPVIATASAGGKTTVTSPEATAITATADLPVNAVTSNTTVTITPTATTATAAVVSAIAAAPTGKSVVGSYVYNYSATSAGATVSTFAQPVTISITYTAAQIAGLQEGSLKIYRWTGTAWQALTSTVNVTTKTVTATTTTFSYYILMAEPTVAECSCTAWVNDVCGGGTCASTEKRQTRTCTPAACLAESQCLADTACAPAVVKPITEMTIAELKAEIARILALIAEIQAKIAALTGVQAFATDLEYGMTNNSEVKRLQEFLISKGYLASGLNTGNYFSLTVEAVKAYQTAKGITPVAGYFGPKTRAAVNTDLGVSQ